MQTWWLKAEQVQLDDETSRVIKLFPYGEKFYDSDVMFNSSFLLKQFNPISQGKGLKMVLNEKGKKWLFPETCSKDYEFFWNLKNASFEKLE